MHEHETLHETGTWRELPWEYTVEELHDGRFYPKRFDHFRRDVDDRRLSYAQRQEAIEFCWGEHQKFLTAHPFGMWQNAQELPGE